jgi:hypothetical protein
MKEKNLMNEVMEFSESTLIQGALTKDPKAFEIIYDTYFPKIYNYTFSQVNDKKGAEELTEEILTEAMTTLDECYDHSSLLTWFFNITCKHIHEKKMQLQMELVCPRQNGKENISAFFKFEEMILQQQIPVISSGGY